MRDLVWPYLTAGEPPYAKRERVVRDVHHPTRRVSTHTAALLHLYVAEKFLGWAPAAAAGAVDYSL
jgi:hypothetical protein